MKIKSLVGILLVLLTIGFVGCNDDDNQLRKDSLPETVQAFIDSRLPGYTVLNIDQIDDYENEMNEKYIVTMSGDIVLSFSSLGFWRRIESSSELPQLIQDVLAFGGAEAIKVKYPSKTINKIHSRLYGYMATLNDDTKLAFYDTSYSNKFGLDLTNSPLSWPEVSRNLLVFSIGYVGMASYHYFIQEDEEDGSGYRFGAYQASVFFDKDGEWYYVYGGYSMLSKISNFLPEQSKKILSEEYGLGTGKIITALVRNEAYYQVMLSSEYNELSTWWYMFYPQTGLEIKAPEQVVFDFLKDYIGISSGELKLQPEIMFNIKQDIFHFTGKIDGKTVVNIYTDGNGQMLGLNVVGSTIPNTVLSYLPEKVKEYAEANYAEKEILYIMNGMNNKYCVEYKDNSRIYFDKDGHVVN